MPKRPYFDRVFWNSLTFDSVYISAGKHLSPQRQIVYLKGRGDGLSEFFRVQPVPCKRIQSDRNSSFRTETVTNVAISLDAERSFITLNYQD